MKLSEFHTFCARRFDRSGKQRRFYASAMTMLGRDTSAGTSYLELAQFLQLRGDPKRIGADLEQLFRRVLFKVLVGNRDDHLRNHGFLLTANGWRLAPAFDVNPNIHKAEHVLNLDESSPHPSIEAVLGTHEYYGLEAARSEQLVREISTVVAHWRTEARRLPIAAAEIELMATAFSLVA